MSNSSMTGQDNTGSEPYTLMNYQKDVAPPLPADRSLSQSSKNDTAQTDEIIYVSGGAKHDLDYFM